MDGEEELEALADWAFVEDTIAEPENVDKAGYRLAGWYTDAQLSDPWAVSYTHLCVHRDLSDR